MEFTEDGLDDGEALNDRASIRGYAAHATADSTTSNLQCLREITEPERLR